jgi:hypothetical protein
MVFSMVKLYNLEPNVTPSVEYWNQDSTNSTLEDFCEKKPASRLDAEILKGQHDQKTAWFWRPAAELVANHFPFHFTHSPSSADGPWQAQSLWKSRAQLVALPTGILWL